MTLFEHITHWMYEQQTKHGFPDDYAESLVNSMSQFELLKLISEYLEQQQVKEEIK